MIPTFRRSETGLGSSLTVSLITHLAIYALVAWLHFLPGMRFPDAPVYYVDIVDLPVDNPRAGTPSAPVSDVAPPPAAPLPPQEMKLPARNAPRAKPAEKPVKAEKLSSEMPQESSRAFEERLAQLGKSADSRHQAAALEAIRNRTQPKDKGQSGIPGGTGSEAGSDYASYIRSRLVDAFKTTITYQDKSPRMIMVLTIDRSGRVVKKRVENSTGDKLFEDSVHRAIIKAEKLFRPPPGGGTFEYGFIFTAQGVGKQ